MVVKRMLNKVHLLDVSYVTTYIFRSTMLLMFGKMLVSSIDFFNPASRQCSSSIQPSRHNEKVSPDPADITCDFMGHFYPAVNFATIRQSSLSGRIRKSRSRGSTSVPYPAITISVNPHPAKPMLSPSWCWNRFEEILPDKTSRDKSRRRTL